MNKFFLLFTLLCLAFASHSQEVGLRFGDAVGGDVAVDAVFGFGKLDRIHADASFGDGFGLEIIPDFFYDAIGGEALAYYIGAGPSLLIGDDFLLGLAGEAGLEYRFNEIPIVIGGDWRPTFFLLEETDFVGDFFGLNVRLNFGEL